MIESINVKSNPMETGRLNKLILRFAAPCVVAMVVSALYNIVDQIFIGWGVGYIGNAATNVSFPIVVLAQACALLLGDGTAAFYSIKLGQGNKEDGAKSIGNAITLLLITSVIFLVIGYAFLEKLLWMFGATSTNIIYALPYAKIILIAIPCSILMCGLSSIIRADGSPQYSMISLITGTSLNFILDPIFIFYFHMGIEGAAIATVIGQVISCIICLSYLCKFKNIKFSKKLLKLDFKIVKTIMLFGVSTFLTQVAVTFIIIVSNNMLTSYGAQSIYGSDIPLSSMSIVMKVYEILLGVIIGIAAGTQPIVGYNYGAKNYKRVREAYLILVKLVSIVSIIGFIIFQFFPQGVVYLFGVKEQLYNEFAIRSFRIFLGLCMFIGFEISTNMFFQFIGQPVKAIILTLCKQTIFIIPLMIILPRFVGVEGVLYAGPCSEICSVLTALSLILPQLKRLNDNKEIS